MKNKHIISFMLTLAVSANLLCSCGVADEKANTAATSSESTIQQTTSAATENTTVKSTTETTAPTTVSTTEATTEQTTVSTTEATTAQTTTSTTETTTEQTTASTTETTTEQTTAAATTETTEKQTEPDEAAKPREEINAQLYESYGADAVKSNEFLKRLESSVDISTIHITTRNNAEILSLEDYVDCIVEVFNCDEQYILTSAEAGVRVRGNSTAFYGDAAEIRKNQVPYRIKFNEKQGMLGLNDGAECKNWVLLKSSWNLVSDYIGFKLGEVVVNDDTYCSDCEFVQVYVNQQYKGLYLLSEQNQINKNRVDINEVEKDYKGTDIGYFVEIDNYAGSESDPYFTVDYKNGSATDISGVKRSFVPADYTVKNDIYSDKQTQFISKYVNGCFNILYEAAVNGNYFAFDKNYNLVRSEYDNAYDVISSVIDVNSVVNMYILDEIVHDNDCGEGSFYMCVDFSGESSFDRLTFTAPWDFNWGYEGDAAGKYYACAFNAESFVNEFGDRTNPWYVVFMGQSWFRKLVCKRWSEVYDGFKSVTKETYSMIEDNFDEFARQMEYAPYCGQDLVRWVEERLRWLNGEWGE